MKKFLTVTLAVAAITLGACTVEVKDSKADRPAPTATAPVPEPDSGPTTTEWCDAYLAWWNAPEGSLEEDQAFDYWNALTMESTDPTIFDLSERSYLLDESNGDAWLDDIDAFCGTGPTGTSY